MVVINRDNGCQRKVHDDATDHGERRKTKRTPVALLLRFGKPRWNPNFTTIQARRKPLNDWTMVDKSTFPSVWKFSKIPYHVRGENRSAFSNNDVAKDETFVCCCSDEITLLRICMMVLFMMMMVTMMPWMPEREPIKPGEFGYYLIVFFWVSEDVTWYYFRFFFTFEQFDRGWYDETDSTRWFHSRIII